MKNLHILFNALFIIILCNCHAVIANSSHNLTKNIYEYPQNIEIKTLQKAEEPSFKFFKLLSNQQLEPKVGLEKYDGTILELKNLRDNLVILSLFATWCTSCQEHILQLAKLQNYLEFNDIKDVQIAMVSIDFKSKDDVMKYLTINKTDNLAVYFDQKKTLMQMLGAKNVPTTFIFDKKGFLISIVQSKMKWADNEVVQELLKLKDLSRASAIGTADENHSGLTYSKEAPKKGVIVIN